MSTTQEMERTVAKVLRAIEAVRAGGMVIMVDDEDRENEGDLVFAAEHVRPELVNFMAKEARGLVCLTLAPSYVERLKLPMMNDNFKSGAEHGTAFTVSIEAAHGVTTGISAHDRAHTVRVAISDGAKPEDIVVPGHIFPLKARSGGVLERAGHTEGSVDLCRLAGLKPAAVICEIMNDDGSMARMPELETFAKKFDLPVVAIADIIAYRLMSESLVREIGRKIVRTSHGVYDGVLFESLMDGTRHFALVKGSHFGDEVVDVRVHSQRPLADVFGEAHGGRFRIEYALRQLQEAERAVLVYLMQPDAEVMAERDLAELALEINHEKVFDRHPMDWRLHGTGAQILRELGVRRMRVHSGAPLNFVGLSGFGLEVVDTLLMEPDAAAL